LNPIKNFFGKQRLPGSMLVWTVVLEVAFVAFMVLVGFWRPHGGSSTNRIAIAGVGWSGLFMVYVIRIAQSWEWEKLADNSGLVVVLCCTWLPFPAGGIANAF
jgi:hypothetical protein